MKLTIDQNNLLVIENSNIPQSKEYNYNVGGYEFSSFDKWLVIYHKKQLKIINLKDLWEKMWVIMIWESNDDCEKKRLDINSMNNALKIFEWFDEDTWEKYNFLYKFTENKLEDLNKKLNLLWSKINLEKTSKWICCPMDDEDSENEAMSFLFGLVLVYGSIDIKNWNLKSIKIQVPLFGTYREKSELLDMIVESISGENIFLKTSVQETNDGIVYQITSSDFELLQIFARFYEPIEKWLEISKYTDTLKIKEELMEFLNTNTEIPTEWKSEVLNEIENWMIKILVK